jgi:hypothetical protein
LYWPIYLRRNEIDVAAPDPGSPVPLLVVDEGDGLGIVNEDDVGLVGQHIGVLAVDLAEEIPVVRRELFPDAVERVVHLLRDVEEPLVALDDVPAGPDAEVLEERQHAQEDLGHAAPDRGRVDVLDGPALEPFGEEAELVDRARADDGGIIVNARHDAPPSGSGFF